jgi:hypothetical protein
MRRILFALLAATLFAGCATATIYHKAVTVKKDANGNVTEMTILEEITQPDRKERVNAPRYLNQN